MLRVRDYMLQAEYKYRSMTDGLTNILNKEAIFDALRKYFQAYNPHTTCALIIMDLDNFKTLNDTKGHAAGDVLLKEIGRLLTETFRRLDIIGRFGGDEFVILLKGTADPLLIRNKYTTIQERLKQLTQEQLDIPVTASFGSVYAEDQTVDAHLLFQQADTALYEAKRKEKSSCVIKKYQSET